MGSTTKGQNYTDRMNLLSRIGLVLGVVPPWQYVVHEKRILIQRFYKCYTVVLLLIFVAVNTLAIIGRWTESYPAFPVNTFIITDLALNISITVTNFLSILAPSLLYSNEFKALFQQLHTINQKFDTSKKVAATNKTVCIRLVIGHLTLLVIFIYDGYVWINGVGFRRFRHYTFRDFQYYHLYITVMTMYTIALSMKNRFQEINISLEKLLDVPASVNENIVQVEVEKGQNQHRAARQIAQIYETQIKQITLFNKIFGWQILFMSLSTMMGLLNSLGLLVVSNTSNKNDVLEHEMIILSSLWSLWQLFMGTVVAVSCSNVVKEAKQTADVCFGIILRLPIVSENLQQKVLRHELVVITQLSIYRLPQFSAAGFFSIDYSLLLAIFGSVTSYIIVLIQFNK